VDRLSSTDLINLAAETRDSPMHIGAVVILDGRALLDGDGRLRLADIRAVLEQRVSRVARLRQVIHRRSPFGRREWVEDPGFRIERHVLQRRLAEPVDLLGVAAQLLVAPLDRRRPLWRIWLVTGLPEGRVAAVVVLHHVVADGIAALRLIAGLLDPVDQVMAATPARPPSAHREATPRSWWHGLTRVWGAPRTSLNGPVGPRRRIVVLRLDLDEARQIARRHECTINDLVLGLATGGLRALMRTRGEVVQGVRLHANVAVSMRGPAGATAAGNQTGGIMVRLPVGEPDAVRRLRLVAADSAEAKAGQPPTAANSVLVWLGRLGVLRWYSRRQHFTNVVESNVIGPPWTLRLMGAPVLELVPLGLLVGNVALSFVALSYAGSLVISVQADADRLSDLAVLEAAIREDWVGLRRSCASMAS
jgi:diacylglycerol O-acyltransferase